MAKKKTFRIRDKQGNDVDYGIPASRVMVDATTDLDEKLEDIEESVEETAGSAVKKITYNGEQKTPDQQGNISISQEQPNWNESNTQHPSYVRNKPSSIVNEVLYDQQSRKVQQRRNGVVEDVFTLPEGGGPTTAPDNAMSDESENAVQNKVIKAFVEALVSQAISNLINGAPAALDTLKELADALGDNDDAIAALTTALAAKANTNSLAAVATSGSYNDLSNKPTIPDTSGMLTQSDFSVETQGDGEVDINVGTDTYSINLNHGHENMAKIVKVASEPASMDNDTIYVKVDNLNNPTEIESLYLFGLEFSGGGGTTTPSLRQPADDTTIDVGTIATGDSDVSITIPVKGRNLTQALTVAVTGTGYSVDKQTISAADANTGTTLTITCASSAINNKGELEISSSEVDNICALIANKKDYVSNGLVFHLDGADATTAEWVDRIGGIAFAMSNVTLNNGGVVFNGISSFGKYAAGTNFPANDYTIEVVANMTAVDSSILLFMQNADNVLVFGRTYGENKYQFITTSGTTVKRLFDNAGTGLMTVSAANDTAYQNKSAISADLTGYFGKDAEGGTFLGARASTRNFFAGTIYQIRIYNRVLTQAEVLQNQDIDMAMYNIN